MQRKILTIVTALLLGVTIFVQAGVSASVKKTNETEITTGRLDFVNVFVGNEIRKESLFKSDSRKFPLSRGDGHEINHSA